MWTQPAILQREFANQMAIRITLGATLALLIVLAIPYHPHYWFGWFAPFSVIISMIMFPFQSKEHGILWERFFSVTFGVIIGLTCYTLFINSMLLYCLSLFALSLFCMYQVGNHSRWHYFYFLLMIFTALGISFVFTDQQLVYAFWQFPVTILIALMVVVIVDKIRGADTAAQHARHLAKTIRDDFSHIQSHQTINIDLLLYWKSHLLQTKSELPIEEFKQQMLMNYLLRIIAKKHNLFIKHMQSVTSNKAKFFLHQCHMAVLAALHDSKNIPTMQRKLQMAEINFGITGIKDRTAWVCLNDLTLTAEDIINTHKLDNNEPTDLKLPMATAVAHKGFNKAAFLFSIRTILAVAVSLLLVFSLKLPGGIQTIIATIVTAGSPNAGASALKMFMRFAGIVIGSLAGFAVLLILAATQSLILYILFFAGFVYWMSRWSLTNKYYGYVGLQAALLFLIMLSNTGTRAINIALSTERFYGVIIGGLIAFVVVLLVAPNKPEDVINKAWQQIVDQLHDAWLKLLQPQPSTADIDDVLATTDNNISSLDETLNQQRFMLKSNNHYYDQVDDLRRITSLLRQLNRLIKINKYSAKKVQSIIKQYHIGFNNTTIDDQPQLSTEIRDRFSAKTYYCVEHLFNHWSNFRKYWQPRT